MYHGSSTLQHTAAHCNTQQHSPKKVSFCKIVSFIGLFWKHDLCFYYTDLTLHNPQAVCVPNATVRRQNTLAKVCRSASLPICVRKSSAGCCRGACILYRKIRIIMFQPKNSTSAFLPFVCGICRLAVVGVRIFCMEKYQYIDFDSITVGALCFRFVRANR